MRKSLLSALIATSALAACGGPTQQSNKDLQTFDVREETSDSASAAPEAARRVSGAGPNVSPTAAPGVAFNYQYAFRLASERIADVQEQHARTCEQLGINRCRITGMNYRLVNEREVEAMLQFKLEPALARRFGRAGLEAVQQAEGVLIESQITGEDVGSRIAANTRSIVQLREDLRRLEQQIADRGVAAGEKDGLRVQAEQLRQQIRSAEAARTDQQESLATTPMTFEYGSGSFGSDRPDFGEAAGSAWDGFLWGLYGLFVTLTVLLPWLLALGLILMAVRAVKRHFPRRAAGEPVAPPERSVIPAEAGISDDQAGFPRRDPGLRRDDGLLKPHSPE